MTPNVQNGDNINYEKQYFSTQVDISPIKIRTPCFSESKDFQFPSEYEDNNASYFKLKQEHDNFQNQGQRLFINIYKEGLYLIRKKKITNDFKQQNENNLNAQMIIENDMDLVLQNKSFFDEQQFQNFNENQQNYSFNDMSDDIQKDYSGLFSNFHEKTSADNNNSNNDIHLHQQNSLTVNTSFGLQNEELYQSDLGNCDFQRNFSTIQKNQQQEKVPQKKYIVQELNKYLYSVFGQKEKKLLNDIHKIDQRRKFIDQKYLQRNSNIIKQSYSSFKKDLLSEKKQNKKSDAYFISPQMKCNSQQKDYEIYKKDNKNYHLLEISITPFNETKFQSNRHINQNEKYVQALQNNLEEDKENNPLYQNSVKNQKKQKIKHILK